MDDLKLTDIINLETLQKLQNQFSEATGVASVITDPQGKPITAPSHFCTLCADVIRKTPKGLANCIHSDAVLGQQNMNGPRVQACLSGGLWDAGASISVGNKHLANWLIGQIRNETQTIEGMVAYAQEIGADPIEMIDAFNKVPIMSKKKFSAIADMLFAYVNNFTQNAYATYNLKKTKERYFEKEKELDRERLYLHALMDSIPDNIYFKDLDSKFIRVNQAHAKYFNAESPAQLIGKSDFDYFTDEHAQEAFNDEKEIIGKGITITKEEKETWHNKPDSYTMTSKAPLRDHDGSIIGTFGISKDISEKKEIEQLIAKHNNELRELVAQKDKLFSIIAHDLRTPFNSFLGLTHLLANDIDSFNKETIKKMALDMKNNASRIYDLLSNLLEWSRLQQGGITLSPQHFLLNDVISQCVDFIEENAQSKSITIENDINQATELFADPNVLQIIMHNLLTNAVKFTKKNGHIKISARQLQSGHTEITISDNGIGMTEQLRDNIFKIDGQANRKGTNGEPSSGLGLILCKEFIELHGGTINVQSKTNEGSTFAISLPKKKEAQ